MGSLLEKSTSVLHVTEWKLKKRTIGQWQRQTLPCDLQCTKYACHILIKFTELWVMLNSCTSSLYAVCQFQYIFITRKLCQPFTWYFLSHFHNYTLSSFLPFVTVVLCDWIVELLEHVSLESHEYVTEILQTIQRSYKDGSSKAQFRYTRPRLVHNSRLQDNVSHVWFWSWISQA